MYDSNEDILSLYAKGDNDISMNDQSRICMIILKFISILLLINNIFYDIFATSYHDYVNVHYGLYLTCL